MEISVHTIGFRFVALEEMVVKIVNDELGQFKNKIITINITFHEEFNVQGDDRYCCVFIYIPNDVIYLKRNSTAYEIALMKIIEDAKELLVYRLNVP